MRDLFVSIACYRDFDVFKTVPDMIATATYPERLRIVVIVQDERVYWSRYYHLQSPQVELYFFDLRWAEGAGKARAEAIKHYNGERYFYQSDSHMRFELGWDEKLRRELADSPCDKPILTTFPPNFEIGTGRRDRPCFNHIMLKHFYRELPITVGVSVDMDAYVPTITPRATPFIAAGVLFTLGRFVEEVQCDPYFYLTGEEISISLRAWTHGWTNYSPRFCFCYHAYRCPVNSAYLPSGENDPIRETFLYNRSIERAQVIAGVKQLHEVLPTSIENLNQYWIGTSRTITSWEQTYGINLKKGTAESRAYFTS